MPLVSVVIPVYNAEKFITDTIGSVQQQSISDIEIIAVNDGSRDLTSQVLQELKKKDPRIVLIDKPNTGVCDTRNTGIRHAKGTYIAFLDADDLWEKNNLEEKLGAIRSSGAKWAYSDLSIIDEKGNSMKDRWVAPVLKNFSDDIYLCDITCIGGPSSNIVVEHEFMRNLFFDRTIASPADRDFCIQLSRRGNPVFVNKKLWRYRVHSNSMNATNSSIADDMQLMYQKYLRQRFFRNSRLKNIALYKLYLMTCKIYLKNDKKYIKAFRSFLLFIFYKVAFLSQNLFTIKKS